MVTTDWGTFPAALSPSEAIMWKGDNHARLRSGGPLLLLLDRAPEWSAVLASFERFSRLFPRLRQRIVTTPMGLRRPRWAVDSSFDLTHHLRRVALPQPVGREELLRIVEHDAASGFDALRPPWFGTVVEGLPDNRAALILKCHHVLFDGRGMMEVFERCLDDTRHPGAYGPVAAPDPEDVSELELLRSALQPRRLVAGARRASRRSATADLAALRPDRMVGSVVGVARSMGRIAGPGVKDGSPLLRGRSTSVRVDSLEAPLVSLKAAAKARGGSLNDALLAVVAAALGRYHELLGSPTESVNLALPISVRTSEDGPGGNRFAGATVCIPTDLIDPDALVSRVHEQVREAREHLNPELLDVLSSVVEHLPSWLLAALPLMDKIDAQVSNFPGLSEPRFLGGSEVLRSFGFGPHPGTPMMIVLISHVGTCCLGVNADAGAVSDFPLFMRCLREELDRMLAGTAEATA